MSDYSPQALYARISITPDNFARFMASRPTHARDYNDWQAWFDHVLPSWSEESQITPSMILYPDIGRTNQIVTETQIKNEDSVTRHEYDMMLHVWKFCILYFKEDYASMIPWLALLRGVESYKKNDPDDFIIITNYFLVGERSFKYDSIIQFNNGGSAFYFGKIPDGVRVETMKHLDAISSTLE